jgi:hypothetical protein
LYFVGPIFLARARRLNLEPEIIDYGEQIVTISVLAILILAPIGGMCIMNLGPVLLDNSQEVELPASSQGRHKLHSSASLEILELEPEQKEV